MMIRMAFILLFLCPATLYASEVSTGHHMVTSPKDCPAVSDDTAEPALHYMPHAYKRCLEMSRKIKSVEEADDTPSVNEKPVSYEKDTRAPQKYYRITPRIREERVDE